MPIKGEAFHNVFRMFSSSMFFKLSLAFFLLIHAAKADNNNFTFDGNASSLRLLGASQSATDKSENGEARFFLTFLWLTITFL